MMFQTFIVVIKEREFDIIYEGTRMQYHLDGMLVIPVKY